MYLSTDIVDPDMVEMVGNRIRKNSKRLEKWRRRNTINSWRIYDADIPEYAAAIDVYDTETGRWLVVQEYKPGKKVDSGLADRRLNALVSAAQNTLEVPSQRCVLKRRERQRGTNQYQRQQEPGGESLVLVEGEARLHVNLKDYLDTGIFLDHRPIRRFVAANSKGKKLLNLFCYTSSVTVHGALGGASESLSIDLSNTYLDWSRRNFINNGIDQRKHKLLRADCTAWLSKVASLAQQSYDLIFLDPPSFSNSSSMEGVLDVQRDHERLVRECMEILAPNGLLIFSNNLRSFKLAEGLAGDYQVEDYHRQSLDPDFERNPKIHRCYLFRQG